MNNFNNGLNGGWNPYPNNNGGFNNGYQQGGFNNNPYGQQRPVMNFNADSVILELQNAISATMNGQTHVMFVRDTVERMIREGKLRKIGGGQNRVSVELIPDDSKFRNMLGINGPMLLMVPVKLPEGIKDNVRAASGYSVVFKQGMNMDPAMQIIKATYLPSVIIPNTNILAQKRIIRIEDCNGVKALLKSGKYDANKELASTCRDYLLENPNIYGQYVRLIQSFDKYFVMADLNAEFSPWNFGFDIASDGSEVLKILDYGYVAWKSKPLVCPKCGHPLKYCIPGEEFLKDPRNRQLSIQVGVFGQYSCKNPNCQHRNGGTVAPYLEQDISVFLRYTENLGR